MEGGEFPDVVQLFNSMSCNHCIDPECLNGCPTNSYIKLENGVVKHIDESCIGCQYCTWNCPYEVPVMNYDRGIVTKCDMCVDKLSVGETPACVQACPAGAIEIEVVNKEEWIKNGLKKEGVAPLLPDVEITKPTTRYTLPKDLPKNLKPADERLLKPAHSELPLVFMTVLTQISLGAFLALFLGELLAFLGFDLPKPNFWMALFAFLPSAIGLPLSALHLGRPFLAITAMKNIKTSWLSREALALGVFTAFMSLIVALYYFEIGGFIRLFLEALTLAVGIYGIYAQSMIYRVKARPSWDRSSTTKRFFATSYVGFFIIAIALFLSSGAKGAIVLLSLLLLAGFAQVLIIYNEVIFYRHLDKDDKNYYELDRTRRLLSENFRDIKKFRLYSLILSALILPLLSILFISSGDRELALGILSVAFIVAMLSELSGRYLFYTTVVPKGLAGNFFAGNQRG
jgi:Fe-S-cluster-containing dehydrogenase component/DMSO reductase anchor subunit